MDIEYEILHDGKRLWFMAEVSGEIAHIDYRHYAGEILFVRTFVPESVRGRGIGGRLAQTALEFARSGGKKIILFCPFMTGYVERHPEYTDLVARDLLI